MNYSTTSRTQSRAEITNAFLRSIYNWMLAGLGVTAGISLLIRYTDLVYFFMTPQGMLTQNGTMVSFGSLIAAVVMSFVFGARINKMAPTTCTVVFFGYSVLMAVGLTPMLLSYTDASVAQAFLTAAGMFGATSIYGLVTKKDLSSIGSFCMMGLWGLIIAMVLNLFFQSPIFDLALSLIGIVIFIGLTAYETQLFKTMGESLPENDTAAIHRAAIMGALTLYLNFINIFIRLLAIMGDRR